MLHSQKQIETFISLCVQFFIYFLFASCLSRHLEQKKLALDLLSMDLNMSTVPSIALNLVGVILAISFRLLIVCVSSIPQERMVYIISILRCWTSGDPFSPSVMPLYICKEQSEHLRPAWCATRYENTTNGINKGLTNR